MENSVSTLLAQQIKNLNEVQNITQEVTELEGKEKNLEKNNEEDQIEIID